MLRQWAQKILPLRQGGWNRLKMANNFAAKTAFEIVKFGKANFACSSPPTPHSYCLDMHGRSKMSRLPPRARPPVTTPKEIQAPLPFYLGFPSCAQHSPKLPPKIANVLLPVISIHLFAQKCAEPSFFSFFPVVFNVLPPRKQVFGGPSCLYHWTSSPHQFPNLVRDFVIGLHRFSMVFPFISILLTCWAPIRLQQPTEHPSLGYRSQEAA